MVTERKRIPTVKSLGIEAAMEVRNILIPVWTAMGFEEFILPYGNFAEYLYRKLFGQEEQPFKSMNLSLNQKIGIVRRYLIKAEGLAQGVRREVARLEYPSNDEEGIFAHLPLATINFSLKGTPEDQLDCFILFNCCQGSSRVKDELKERGSRLYALFRPDERSPIFIDREDTGSAYSFSLLICDPLSLQSYLSGRKLVSVSRLSERYN